MIDQKLAPRRCHDCGVEIFYPRECDGRPHKCDAAPVANGAYIIVAWNARLHGERTTFIAPFDPETDDGEDRFRDHLCQENI